MNKLLFTLSFLVVNNTFAAQIFPPSTGGSGSTTVTYSTSGISSLTEISGLVTWVSASSGTFQTSACGTPATAANDPVACMYDLSGSGNHFTQTVASSQPFLTPNAQNSLPAVQFDGTGDNLANASVFQTVTDFTIIVVGKNISGTGEILSNYASSKGLIVGNLFVGELDTTSGNFTSIASLNPPLQLTLTPYVYSVRRSTQAADLQWNINGQTFGRTSSGGTGAVGTLTAAGNLTIGARPGPSNFFAGYIHEIAIWTRRLSKKEWDDAIAYESAKWRI